MPACTFHFFPLPPLWGSQEPPARGSFLSLTTGLLSHSPVSGSSGGLLLWEELVSRLKPPLSWILAHHCSVLSQLRPQGPLGPRPHGSAWSSSPRPGPSLSHPLQGRQELPLSRAGCLLCPGASVVSGAEPTGTCGATTMRTAASSCLLTSSLWVGPGPTVCPGSHLIPVLLTGSPLHCSMPAAQRACGFTHLPGAQSSWWAGSSKDMGSSGHWSAPQGSAPRNCALKA